MELADGLGWTGVTVTLIGMFLLLAAVLTAAWTDLLGLDLLRMAKWLAAAGITAFMAGIGSLIAAAVIERLKR